MDHKERDELQAPENWNWDAAESRSGDRKHRAVVSVAFQRQDFDSIALYAESVGKTVSALIREAVLEKVAAGGVVATFSYTIVTRQPPYISQIPHQPAATAHVTQNPLTQEQ